MVGARWVARSANPEAACGLGPCCSREEAQLPSIFAQQAMQMSFVHDDHVIQHLSSGAADPSFGNPILPWGVGADQAATSKRPFVEALFQSS